MTDGHAMTRDDAMRAAERSASAAFRACGGPAPLSFLDALEQQGRPDDLAAFVERFPEAPADTLYAHAMRRAGGTAAWRDAPRSLRVATEIFRASYLVLLRMVDEDAQCAAPADAKIVLFPGGRPSKGADA